MPDFAHKYDATIISYLLSVAHNTTRTQKRLALYEKRSCSSVTAKSRKNEPQPHTLFFKHLKHQKYILSCLRKMRQIWNACIFIFQVRYGLQSSLWVSTIYIFHMDCIGFIWCTRDTPISISWVYTVRYDIFRNKCKNVSFSFAFISKWDDDSDLFEFAAIFIMLINVNSFTLSLCEPGTKMITEFDIFGEELGRCGWYSLPIELQQMYMVFLSDTQHPIQISTYGGITCTRETMEKVTRSNNTWQLHTWELKAD